MDPTIHDDEVLSGNQSRSTTRPSSSSSSDMSIVDRPLTIDHSSKRQSSNIDINDIPTSIMKRPTYKTPSKVLVFNGKCSDVFKATLEDCVEDCILEFPTEKCSVYISKAGQSITIPFGSNQNYVNSTKDKNNNSRLSSSVNRRRSSINQLNTLTQVTNTRTSVQTNFSLPAVALTTATSVRMRHQLAQQRYSVVENITEESEQRTTILQTPITAINDIDYRSEHQSQAHDGSNRSSPDTKKSASLSQKTKQSAKTLLSYRDRQKNYRLSDLVLLGPEHYANVFNLRNIHAQTDKQDENLTNIEKIKKDLFHRYLWTQKPQVSCRIRPLSTYARSTTFAI